MRVKRVRTSKKESKEQDGLGDISGIIGERKKYDPNRKQSKKKRSRASEDAATATDTTAEAADVEPQRRKG